MSVKTLLAVCILATLLLFGFLLVSLIKARFRYGKKYLTSKSSKKQTMPSLWQSGPRSELDKKIPPPPPFFRWWIKGNVWVLSCVVGVYALTVSAAVYVKWQQRSPKSRTGMYAGSQSDRQKQLRKRYIELTKAIEKNPDDAVAHLNLAKTLRDMGAGRQAMNEYRKVIFLDPKSLAARFGLGRLAIIAGETNVARTQIDEMTQMWPSKPEPHLLQAQIDLRLGRKDLAKAQWQTALGKDPANHEARELLVTYYLEERAFSDAVRVAEAGVKQAPDDTGQQLLLATCLTRAGRIHDAINILQDTATRDRTSPEPVLMLGDLQVASAQYIPAIKSYEEVLKRSPGHGVAMNNLAQLIADHGYELDRAAELASQMYAAHPQDPMVADTLGWVLFRQGKFDQALPLLRQAIVGAPKNPTHHYHYGVALLKAGQTVSGRKELETALKISENFDGASTARSLLAKKS